jgi:ubiquinone/menaquinone biosynthesis C-methylase UbiE
MHDIGANLRTGQYKDSHNLAARIALHERFSTNRYGWHRWALDQLDLSERASILEVGCGDGSLWYKNRERLPSTWSLTLSDFSSGMLCDAKLQVRSLLPSINFVVADAQALPFENKVFDCVIANHMLYHLADQNRALREMRRVLTTEGVLIAATNGRDHLHEIWELLADYDKDLTVKFGLLSHELFNLETGAEQLTRYFKQVEIRCYPDSLIITEAHPLIQYVNSSLTTGSLLGDRLSDFTAFIESKIKEHGAIQVTKITGLFLAHHSS